MFRLIRREFFILSIFLRLLARDFKKYFKVASLCYFIGVFRISRPAKPAYFFCRYMDDLADGDVRLPKKYHSLEHLVQRLKNRIDHGAPGASKVEILLADVLLKYEKYAQKNEMVCDALRAFLGSMLFDFNRRKNRTLLTGKELLDNYHFSFSAVIQLAAIGLQIEMPLDVIRGLGELQGRFYALQDIQSDLEKGIINIPQEVVVEAGLTNDLDQCLGNAVFGHWVQSEIESCEKLARLLQSNTGKGRMKRMIDALVNPIVSDIEKGNYVQVRIF